MLYRVPVIDDALHGFDHILQALGFRIVRPERCFGLPDERLFPVFWRRRAEVVAGLGERRSVENIEGLQKVAYGSVATAAQLLPLGPPSVKRAHLDRRPTGDGGLATPRQRLVQVSGFQHTVFGRPVALASLYRRTAGPEFDKPSKKFCFFRALVARRVTCPRVKSSHGIRTMTK
jgi:hypothetical protein